YGPDVADVAAGDVEGEDRDDGPAVVRDQARLAVHGALEDGHARRADGQVGQVAGDLLGALDRFQRGGGEPAAVRGERDVRVEQRDERGDVVGLPGVLELAYDGELPVGGGRRGPGVADPAASGGGKLPARGRGAADDAGDLAEGVAEDVVQDERDALGRGHRLQHDE